MPLNLNELPEAVAVPKRRRLPQLVWLVPLIATIIGVWLLLDTIAQQGQTVVISFLTAEGIEPGKTRIRYKNVDIGKVKTVKLAKDRSHVLVTAQLVKQADDFRAADTRFWVVRPRVSGGKISGLGTLLSGAYIGVDVGRESAKSNEFTGLEVAPILTSGQPGRHFILHADDIGSLDVGSPVYFRHVQVGEVVAHQLEKDGGSVNINVFVHAPYDQYVTQRTHFWNASGVDVSMDANGVRLQSQSLLSVMIGGIAFEASGSDQKGDEAPANAVFVLYPDRALAMKAPDREPLILTMNFSDSIRGLTTGAPVDFRGIVVGEVLSAGVEYEKAREWFHFPVKIALYTERISLRGNGKDVGSKVRQGLVKAVNERGLRAQLRTGNMLTGQLYIALDFFPDLKKTTVDWNRQPLEFPTVRGNFEGIQESLSKVLSKLEKMPLEEISADIRKVLNTIDHSASSFDKLAQRIDGEMAPEITASVKELRATLATAERLLAADSPLQQDVRDALREVGRAAQSFRTLSDTLESQPESLIRGKKEDKP